MAYEQKDGDISVFPNDSRTEENNRANMQGSVMIEGKKYWVNLWTKSGSKGRYQSGRIELADEKYQPEPMRRVPQTSDQPAGDDFNDDIPF